MAIASFGGIEAKKKINYDAKVRYFRGLRSTFNKALPGIDGGFKNWYIPKWEDIKTWKKRHKTENIVDGNKVLKTPGRS